jgi:hypothetical protein
VEDSADCLSCFHDKRCGFIGNGKLGLDCARGRQCLDFYDVLIVDRSIHVLPFKLEEAQHNEMLDKSLHGCV